MSLTTREEILAHITGGSAPTAPMEPEEHAADVDAPAVIEADEPSDLSPAQVRKLLEGCTERPKSALRFIAREPDPTFLLSRMIEVIGADATGSARGVLAAITRRTRTVLGDSGADFVWWTQEGATWRGTISATTHSSLRKAFGLN